MTATSPLGLRLFLEGVEVPVVAAQVDVSPDQPAAASIQVVPSEMGVQLLPRTLVHLFYLDEEGVNAGAEAAVEAQDVASEQADKVRSTTFYAIDEAYKLMFSGEIIGFSYEKTPSSRQLTFHCMDLSSYWDVCYQWFADYSVGGTGLTDKSHTFVGAGQGLFDNVAGGHKWVIGRILNTAPKSPEYRRVKGLLGGLIHLLESIGGLKYRDTSFKGYNGVNDFFSVAELRYNLLGMVGAVEKDDTSAKLYASKAFRSWLRNGMTSMGNLLSFRDILNHVNRYIFHNIYPNPAPLYLAPDTTKVKKKVRVDSTILSDFPVGQLVLQKIRDALRNLGGAATDYTGASFGPIVNLNAEAEYAAGTKQLRRASLDLQAAQASVGEVPSDDASDVSSNIRDAQDKVQEALRTEERGAPGGGGVRDISFNADEILVSVEAAIEILQEKVLGQKSRAKKLVSRNKTVPLGGHLYTQLILPEVFFVSPPRCNVIFPDNYFQFSYSRNFLREITRLSVQGGMGILGSGRGAKVLARHYFAPNIRDVRGKNLRATLQYGARIILPHEIHSGIIPKFEWVTDGHRWGVKAAKERGRQDKFFKAGKIGYIQRLANYQFFLHRWSSRTMRIDGLFMPRIVLGFPGVVIDRGLPSTAQRKAVAAALGRELPTTQYIGKVSQLSHSVSQSGGATSVVFTKARTHRGLDDEFVHVLSRETTKKKVTVIKANPKLLGADPQFGGKNRDKLTKLVRRFHNGELKEGATDSTFFKNAKIDKISERGQVLLNPVEAGRLGFTSDDLTQVGSTGEDASSQPVDVTVTTTTQGGFTSGDSPSSQPAESTFTTRALVLPEVITVGYERRIGTGQFVRSGVAIEDALIPGWYSQAWQKTNITTDVYVPLLGVRSISDNAPISKDDQEKFLKKLDSPVPGEDDTPLGKIEGGLTKIPVPQGSIEEAIDGLVMVYGLLQKQNLNVHSFIREYTYRPIANLKEVLGSANLEFNDKGNVKDPDTMVEGFHSRAYGDYNTEVKLPDKEGTSIQAGEQALHLLFPGVAASGAAEASKRPGIVDRKGKKKKGGHEGIRPEVDPRGRARARVRAYAAELQVSRGLPGS